MTINEFSVKYDIDYSIVYSATWKIQPMEKSWRSKQYDEEELKNAVINAANIRLKNAQNSVKRSEKILQKLGAVTKI